MGATGGTTEYDFELLEPSAATGISAWRVELGFGTGDNFVSAALVFPELDFDGTAPDTTPSAGSYRRVEHFAHLINFSDGDYGDVRFRLDLPDLPSSVLDFYTPEELAFRCDQAKSLSRCGTRKGSECQYPSRRDRH